MTIDPAAPAYLPANGGASPVGALRQALLDALPERVRACAESVGATVAPEHVQSPARDDGLRLTVDLIDGQRVDILAHFTIAPTIPPGWDSAPHYRRGDVVETAMGAGSANLVVLDVLGTNDDPRPGYWVANIRRTQSGTFDPTTIGPARVATVAQSHEWSRSVGTIDLPNQ